jgi:transcriptional regulator with XRE-family HTH domain
MDANASFGNWLTRRRAALGLTRPELARRVSCAAITLRKIEEDARRPSPELATSLAGQLAIPTAECTTFVRVARRAPRRVASTSRALRFRRRAHSSEHLAWCPASLADAPSRPYG